MYCTSQHAVSMRMQAAWLCVHALGGGRERDGGRVCAPRVGGPLARHPPLLSTSLLALIYRLAAHDGFSLPPDPPE